MIALASYQAVAEYIGTLLRGVPMSLDGAFRALTDFVISHPVVTLGSILVLLTLWVVISGSGRRG